MEKGRKHIQDVDILGIVSVGSLSRNTCCAD
jgi:hypothetical protein